MNDDAHSSRWTDGWSALSDLHQTDEPRVVRMLEDVSPDLARFVVEFGYGDCYARPGLDVRTRQLLTIVTLASMGGCERQLRIHIRAALKSGVGRDEVVEAIIHALPFIGFPRMINAVEVIRDTFGRHAELS